MPYAPGITYHGDSFLFDAISNLGKGIGEGIKQYRSNKAASQAADAAYETTLQTVGQLAQSGTLPEEFAKEIPDMGKFSGLSLSQKQAKLGQLATSVTMLAQDSDRQRQIENDAALRDYRQRVARREDRIQAADQAERSANAGFLSDVNDMTQLAGPAGSEPPMMLASGLRDQMKQPGGIGLAALARNPGVSKDVRAMVLGEALKAGESEDLGPLTFQEDPSTGARFALRGRVVLPSGTNPDQEIKTQDIKDEKGRVVGHVTRAGKQFNVMRDTAELAPKDVIAIRRTIADYQKTREITKDPKVIQQIDADIEEMRSMLRGSKGAESKPPDQAPVMVYDPKTRKLTPRK